MTAGRWCLDFQWPEHGLAVETDGHLSTPRSPLVGGTPLKDEDLAALGLRLLRLRWRDVVEVPATTARRVLDALARASRVVQSGV